MEPFAAAPRRGYRRCVGIALFSQDGRVFLGKRASRGMVPSHSWQMPQGGIDPGEGAYAAAVRELYEETSVRSVAPLGELEGWLHYDLPRDVAAWRGRFKGQAQRWFAFRFIGAEGEINVTSPPDGHSAEFSRWRWEALAEVPGIVVPFKRAVYERVVEAFAEHAAPRGLRAPERRAI
ncbi:RNA pyrophosphohydrolase [Acuticoccus sp.]|uniref:RNA pyrophosphohydrolase n=1 Tax=Acuticoccus sp. TaxID=1904378 RepID=UPI003B5285AF